MSQSSPGRALSLYFFYKPIKVRCAVCGETAYQETENHEPLDAVAVYDLRSLYCFCIPRVNTNHTLTFNSLLKACYSVSNFIPNFKPKNKEERTLSKKKVK